MNGLVIRTITLTSEGAVPGLAICHWPYDGSRLETQPLLRPQRLYCTSGHPASIQKHLVTPPAAGVTTVGHRSAP